MQLYLSKLYANRTKDEFTGNEHYNFTSTALRDIKK